MERDISADLVAWKDQEGRKPLLVRGARQVGKSYTVEKFGSEYFENIVTINFEFERKYQKLFSTLDPNKIITALALSSNQSINEGKTLLFLDEIQECPDAILALRYFKEKMPKLHVIAAGSLLEFTLNKAEFRMPVGRVQSMYMKPLSFREFLFADGREDLIEFISAVNVQDSIDDVVHETLLEKVREYLVLGGMPEVIAHYLEHKNLYETQQIQSSLMEFYQKDFEKYDSVKTEYLQAIFDKAPGMVAERFKFVNVDREIQSRELKPALQALVDAGLINLVYHTAASGVPFSTTANNRKFNMLFVDVGLVNYAGELEASVLMDENIILLNRGKLAEQFVGQELLVYRPNYRQSQLYYWEREQRGSTAEVDYVINIRDKIFPIEVKSGKTGRLKSLQIFISEHQSEFGVRISQKQFSFENKVLSIPLYMMSELERLIQSV